MHANIPIFVAHLGCPRHCSFCNQNTISGTARTPTPTEVTSLCREALAGLPKGFDTVEIAFFGGSFTAIPREEMVALLEAVQEFREDKRVVGIRISTRPDAINEEILKILRRYGVRAIELGAQSLYNEVLDANGRGHSAQQVTDAAAQIHGGGFELGLQMMTGLYGSSRELDWGTGEKIAELMPDTVRIYPTVVLRGTPLDNLMQEGRYTPPTLEETIDLCADLVELFEGKGIRILRLGLHPSKELEENSTGGCYHPALGELCRSRLYRRKILKEIQRYGPEIALEIHGRPEKISQIIGQKRSNLYSFREQHPGLTVVADDKIPGEYQIRPMKLEEGGAVCDSGELNCRALSPLRTVQN